MRDHTPMMLVDLAQHLVREDSDSGRWRLIAEFLEEYRHEPPEIRRTLVADGVRAPLHGCGT